MSDTAALEAPSHQQRSRLPGFGSIGVHCSQPVALQRLAEGTSVFGFHGDGVGQAGEHCNAQVLRTEEERSALLGTRDQRLSKIDLK
jgi:hypothetical protein